MRLFVGLELPRDIRSLLAGLAARGIPGARWLPAENYHLTLRFIGETPAWRAEEIDSALSELRAREFALTMAGLGTFSKSDRATTLWVGVERSEQLWRLRAKIETALQRAGLEPERRRFSPHVTLARLDNVPEAKLAGFRAGKQSVSCSRCYLAAFHAVQFTAWEGAGGLYGGGGVRAGSPGRG